jgi:hypothetical protein
VCQNPKALPKVISMHAVTCADAPVMTLRDHSEVKSQVQAS